MKNNFKKVCPHFDLDRYIGKRTRGDKSMKKNRLFTVVGIVIALCIAIALYMFVPRKAQRIFQSFLQSLKWKKQK